MKPNLENISQLQCTVRHDKDVIKRRFHSLSLERLSSVFGSTNEPSYNADDKDSLLMTLFIVSAGALAIVAAVQRLLASK
jgi:hypothetical protein